MRLRAAAVAAVLPLATAVPAVGSTPTVVVDRAPVSVLDTGDLDDIQDVAVGVDGRTYVLDGQSVGVYAAGARGAAARTATLAVPTVADQVPRLLTVDADGFVTTMSTSTSYEASTFHVFDRAGTVVAAVTDAELGIEQAIAIDAVGDQVAVVDLDSNDVDVVDLRGETSGPTRVLPGGSTTRISTPLAVAGAPDGGLVVSGVNNDESGDSVWVAAFGPAASGAVAPDRYLEGGRTRMGTYPADLDVDAAGGIYVSGLVLDDSPGDARIARFAPGATGNVAPAAVLQGARAGLGDASGLNLGPRGTVLTTPYTVVDSGDGFEGGDRVLTHRALGPYARPGKVRSLRATGTTSAARRTVTWTAPVVNADTPVRGYAVKVVCAGRTRLTANPPASRRSVVVTLGTVRRGSCTATVSARTALGAGPAAKVTFAVRR